MCMREQMDVCIDREGCVHGQMMDLYMDRLMCAWTDECVHRQMDVCMDI